MLRDITRTPVNHDQLLYSGLDFWNDPDRWRDIDDPKRVKFWMKVYYPGYEPMKRKIRQAVEREQRQA